MNPQGIFSAGRIDRKIEFPLPDEKTKRRIFQIHTSRMTLAEDVILDDFILAKDDLSGADIKVCQWFGSFESVAENLCCPLVLIFFYFYNFQNAGELFTMYVYIS